MTTPPARPKIYHITHVNNLPSILTDGCLWSDAVMVERGGPTAAIGLSGIKERRLKLPVRCHPGDHVGDSVPFFFCPRSIMLYIFFRDNRLELTYHGGQGPIVHLEADLFDTVAWAEGEGRHWAFSLSNAGTRYAKFRNRLDQLGELDWDAVAARDFRDGRIAEGKQAEFLVRDFMPWRLIERIGVQSASIRDRVAEALDGSSGAPTIEIQREWYY